MFRSSGAEGWAQQNHLVIAGLVAQLSTLDLKPNRRADAGPRVLLLLFDSHSLRRLRCVVAAACDQSCTSVSNPLRLVKLLVRLLVGLRESLVRAGKILELGLRTVRLAAGLVAGSWVSRTIMRAISPACSSSVTSAGALSRTGIGDGVRGMHPNVCKPTGHVSTRIA